MQAGKRLLTILMLVAGMCGGSSSAWALAKGPVIANNILGGASSGASLGLAAGLWAYGSGKNFDPTLIVNGAVYGFLGGAVAGTGLGIYEISTQRSDPGFTFFGYVSGGTAIGALLGSVVAVIPYTRDKQSEDFTIGLGAGGTVGGILGMVLAVWDIEGRTEEKAVLSSLPNQDIWDGMAPISALESSACFRMPVVDVRF